jgi:hypothetical protein
MAEKSLSGQVAGPTHLNFLLTKITSLVHFNSFGRPVQRHLGLKSCRKHSFERKSACLEHVFEWSSLTKQSVNKPQSGKRI